jgi:hypothetical protein
MQCNHLTGDDFMGIAPIGLVLSKIAVTVAFFFEGGAGPVQFVGNRGGQLAQGCHALARAPKAQVGTIHDNIRGANPETIVQVYMSTGKQHSSAVRTGYQNVDCSNSPQAALHIHCVGISHCDFRFAVGGADPD